jgi:DNA polymerase III alpha subunit
MYSEGTVSKTALIKARKKYTLRNSDHIQWAEYVGNEYVGEKKTYDITVNGPNHNFIAGNFVVHNCLKAKDEDGVSMTDLFCLRKNGEKEISYYVPSLEPILNKTYGVLVYQEQSMDIAVQLAGFNPQEADSLRKAIGKKDTDLMAKTKKEFLEKAKSLGVVTEEQAESIFQNIEKSARYQFNKSHSVSYGIIGYQTAHAKAHFPIQFFTSYLFHAKEKQDPLREIKELVNDARAFGFDVIPPKFNDLEANFSNDGIVIKFGLADVKGIGFNIINKMKTSIEEVEETCHKCRTTWSWFDFLIYFSDYANGGVVKRMIEVGAMSDYKLSRQKMLAEYEIWKSLTDKEQARIAQMKLPNPNSGGLFPSTVEGEPENLTHAIEMLLEVPKGVANKNRRSKVESLLKMLHKPPRPLTDDIAWVANIEEQLLGLPITVNRADASHESEANTTCQEYRDGKDEKEMRLGVDIQDFREITIQNGDNRGRKMCFLTVSDKTCSLEDVTLFSDMYEKYGNLISIGNTIEICGRRDYRRGSFIVEEVKQL